MNSLRTICLRPARAQKRSNALWNMIGSILFALPAVLLFAVAKRLTDSGAAGVFSIAYTTGQLLATLAYYEMRSYQVTDTGHSFAFGEYLTSRLITCAAALAAGLVYAAFAGSPLRGGLIALMCLYKVTDAFADVFEGEFHRCGRLDLMGKSLALRTAVSTAGFILVLALTRSLIWASAAAVILSALIVLLFNGGLIGAFAAVSLKGTLRGAGKLLLECAALCAGGFLSLYITSAAKYAIDAVLTPEAVSVFTALYLPTSAINLMSGFIFRPQLTRMGELCRDGDDAGLRRLLGRLLGAAGGLTLVCAAGAWLLGIPVLQRIFALDLSGCRLALLLLILGGGFNAMSVLLFYALTALRRQKLVLLGYALTALPALTAARPLVRALGLNGGALCCMGLLLVQTLLFGAFFLAALRRRQHK